MYPKGEGTTFKNATEILADIPNFTNTQPTVQVSKVMV
jgi:hypothetical protein